MRSEVGLNLLRLPDDVLVESMRILEWDDLCSLACTCRRFRDLKRTLEVVRLPSYSLRIFCNRMRGGLPKARRLELGAITVSPSWLWSCEGDLHSPEEVVDVHARRLVWRLCENSAPPFWLGARLSAKTAALDLHTSPFSSNPRVPFCAADEYLLYLDASRWGEEGPDSEARVASAVSWCNTFSGGASFDSIYVDIRMSQDQAFAFRAAARLAKDLRARRLVVDAPEPPASPEFRQLCASGVTHLALSVEIFEDIPDDFNSLGCKVLILLEHSCIACVGSIRSLSEHGVLSLFGANIYGSMLADNLRPWSDCVSLRGLGAIPESEPDATRRSLVSEDGCLKTYLEGLCPSADHAVCMAARDGDASVLRHFLRYPVIWDGLTVELLAQFVGTASEWNVFSRGCNVEIFPSLLRALLSAPFSHKVPEERRAEVVRFLLAQIDPDTLNVVWQWQNHVSGDYLRSAAWKGETLVVNALLEGGVDPRFAVNSVLTRLVMRRRAQKRSRECLRMILEGCDARSGQELPDMYREPGLFGMRLRRLRSFLGE